MEGLCCTSETNTMLNVDLELKFQILKQFGPKLLYEMLHFPRLYNIPPTKTAWIDLSAAQASGLKFILMGDFNIDYVSSVWLQTLSLFFFFFFFALSFF